MGRFLGLLAVVAVVVIAVVLATGGGSDDLPSVSLAEAAKSTRDAHTARMESTTKVSGMGLPKPVTIKSGGVTDLRELRMDATFDFGPLLELAGAGGDGATRMLVTGGDLYVDPPAIDGLELPGGATWVTVELGQLVRAMGIDPDALAGMVRLTPDQQLEMLASMRGIKEVGEEEIDGVRTTHLSGTFRMREFVQALPRSRRAPIERAIRQLDRLSADDKSLLDQESKAELWVDEQARLRRMVQTSKMPAQRGVPGGTMTMRMELKDFGTPVEIDVPDRSDVYDATPFVKRALRRAR
jgi:hypothetical protein